VTYSSRAGARANIVYRWQQTRFSTEGHFPPDNMANKHIKEWGAFLTIYSSKNCYRTGSIDFEMLDGEIDDVYVDQEEKKGVTTSELADVCNFSTETARRRFKLFESEDLVVEMNVSGNAKQYKPNISEPEKVIKTLL